MFNFREELDQIINEENPYQHIAENFLKDVLEHLKEYKQKNRVNNILTLDFSLQEVAGLVGISVAINAQHNFFAKGYEAQTGREVFENAKKILSKLYGTSFTSFKDSIQLFMK